MQSLLIIVLQGCLVMTYIHTSVAYQYPDSYKVTDDVEDYEDAPQSPPPEEQPNKVDYTKYFGGSVSPIASPSSLQPSSDSFVHSLDFPPFFGGGFSSLDTVPASSPLVAGNIYGLSSSPARYGAPLQPTAGINASASTSQVGFVDPNPYSAFQSLFGSSALQTGIPVYPSYQYLPQQQSTYVQPSTYAQPSASYSLYLPNYQRVKDSVTKNVQKDQRQLSESTMQKVQDAKKQKKKDDIDEFYDKSRSVEDEEDEEEDSGEEDDDEGYSFEEIDEKPKKPAKPESKTESPLGKSSYPLKGGSYSSSYSEKPKKISKSESRSNNRQQSPASNQNYGGAYDYPKVGLEDLKNDYNYDYNWFPSPTKQKEREPVKAQSDNRPVPGYRPTAMTPLPNIYRQANPNSPLPLSIPNTRQSHAHTPKQSSYQTNGYYDRNVPAYTHGTPTKYSRPFVPSANIPYTDGFPKSNKKQYRTSYATAPSELLQVRSKEAYLGDSMSDKKKCTKIEKNVTADPSKTYGGYPMTCYKCHDEATGASSESCSYDTEKTRKSYEEVDPQTIKVEKSVKGPHSIRAKRESPYDLSFSQNTNIGESVTLVRKVRQYAEYDDSSDYDGDGTASDEAHYRFGPEYFKEGSDESTQSSEYVPETEIGEDCTKVTKNGVTCMVCEKETGGTYEQCSYASDPNKNSYSYGSSSRYGHGSGSDKQPRQNANQNAKQNGRQNGRQNGQQNNRKNQGRNKQTRRNRRFTDLHTSNNVKREVTLERNVRQSPKSHNAARKKNKSASKMKGNDPRSNSDEDESYEIPEDFAESVSRISKANNGIVGLDPFFYGSPEDTFASEDKNERQGNKKNDDDDDDDDGDGDEDREASAASSNGTPTYEDYFYRLFPELTEKGNSKNNKQTENSDYDDSTNIEDGEESESQQPSKTLVPGFEFQSSFPDYFEEKEQNEDLEKVLGEFSQKDRSACKKVMKDKMTCYQCVDDKGMQHEECMFVAASEPKSKHLAYHEVKQFNLSPNEKSEKKPVVTNKLANTKPLIFHAEPQHDPNDGLDMDNQETSKSKRRIPTADDPKFVHNGDAQQNNDEEEEEDEEEDEEEEEVIENENSPKNLTESAEIQATENIDIIRLPPKPQPRPSTGGPISKVMIHNQRYFQSTGSSSPEKQEQDQLQRKKRLSPPQNDALMAAVNAYDRRDQRGRGQNSEENERSEDDEYDDEGDAEDSNEDQPKQKKEQKTYEKRKDYNPIPTDPPSFEVPEGPEGAYSTDTEPAYDTTLRITLPRYMLSRSEHEAIFDEVLASG